MRPFVLFGFFLALPAIAGFSLDFWDREEPGPLAQKLVAALTVPELASQVLMLAFPDPVPDAGILNWVQARSLGGIKFFGWNAGTPVQVAQASAAVQGRSQGSRFRIPLLVATDQEGGWVRHIKGTTTTTPGNLSLGAGGLPADAWETGHLLGAELRQMGVNMDFAPSVDLYTNPDNTVIGPRSFSQDPVQAGVLGMALFRGLETQGVIATAKHFPGHGDTADDSHGRLPVILDDRTTLDTRELVPYKMMIAEGLEAIMSGHIAFPNVAGNGLPASLSPQLIDGLLRKDLGFRGVVITDDLYMEGARPAGWSIAQAAVQALEAGNDLLLISKPEASQDAAWRALVDRAGRDPQFLARLQTAARRVLELKLRSLRGPRAVPLVPDPATLAVPAPEADPFVFQQTARSATLLASATLPWTSAGGAPLVVTPYEGAWKALAARFPGSELVSYPYQFFGADEAAVRQVAERAAGGRRVIFVLSTPGSLAYLKALAPWKDRVAVVSVLSPVYLKDVPWVRDAVAVYGTNPAAFEVAAAALAGDIRPRGRLPFRFGDFPGKGL
jgi:beta-N-acetylhexosaminidase